MMQSRIVDSSRLLFVMGVEESMCLQDRMSFVVRNFRGGKGDVPDEVLSLPGYLFFFK